MKYHVLRRVGLFSRRIEINTFTIQNGQATLESRDIVSKKEASQKKFNLPVICLDDEIEYSCDLPEEVTKMNGGDITRMVDDGIQVLFNTGKLDVGKHASLHGMKMLDITAFGKIEKRLRSEHNYILKNKVVADKSTVTFTYSK